MAKTKISELDAAAANNTDINSVDVSEGCAPSGINNAIREMGAMLKRMDVGTDALTSPDIDGGSIDGATIGTNSAITDLRVDNLKLDANTISSTDTNGDITLDPNGTGKVNVVGELEADSLDIDGDGTIDGSLTITTADNTPQLTLTSTDTDADSGPELLLFRHSASPADNDQTGHVQFAGKNDADETIAYAEIDSVIRDASDGTEDGELRIMLKRSGTTREALALGPSDVVFNEGSQDVDVRMESDGNSNMFFLDAGNDVIGIGTGSPTNPLTIRGTGGTGSTAPLRVHDESDQGATLGVQNSGNVALNAEQGDLLLYFGGSQKYTVGSNGNLTIDDGNLVIGTAGHGIDFSATSNGSGTMQNELLDDYEEGTWTPTASTNSGSAASFTTGTCIYTKIGRMVFVRASILNINTSGTTAGSVFRVAGLPFTLDVSDSYGSCTFDQISMQGSRTQITPDGDTAEHIRFVQSGGGGSETSTDHNDITSGASDILFTLTYFTNQ